MHLGCSVCNGSFNVLTDASWFIFGPISILNSVHLRFYMYKCMNTAGLFSNAFGVHTCYCPTYIEGMHCPTKFFQFLKMKMHRPTSYHCLWYGVKWSPKNYTLKETFSTSKKWLLLTLSFSPKESTVRIRHSGTVYHVNIHS